MLALFNKKLLEKNILIFSILSIWGIQIILLFIFGNGLPQISRFFTSPYRLFVSIYGILIFLNFSNKYFKKRSEFFLVVLFYILFIIRALYDSYRIDIQMGTKGEVYLLRWLSIVVLPSLPFFLNFKSQSIFSLLKGFKLSVIAFFMVAIVFYRKYLFMDYRTLHHTEGLSYDNMISPLIFGYVGLFGISIFLWEWFHKNFITKISLFLLFLSLFGLFYSGSRGPFISALIILLIIVFLKIKSIKSVFNITLAIALLVFSFLKFINVSNSKLIERFLLLYKELNTGSNKIGSNRGQIWYDSILQFFDSPIFGSGIEEFNVKYVAHNMYLEAFTSTGFLGGMIFFVLIFITLKKSIFLLKINHYSGFLSILFISRLITGLLSSSIQDPVIWFLILLITTSYYNSKNEINSRRRV